MRRAFVTLVAIMALGAVLLGAQGRVGAQATPEATPVSGPSHPAHIHSGSCAALGDVVAPLSNVSASAENNGTPMAMNAEQVGSPSAIPVFSSITTVDVSMDDILAGEHAINVHESAENIGNYVACGDIGGTMIGESDLLFGIAELNGSGLSGVGSLHDNGDGTTTVYVYLTHATAGGMGTPVASPVA